jgi:hypothetical protein
LVFFKSAQIVISKSAVSPHGKREYMPYVRILACLAVETKDGPEVTEGILELIDSLIIRHIPVFDSDVRTTRISEVRNADEVRREIRPDTK